MKKRIKNTLVSSGLLLLSLLTPAVHAELSCQKLLPPIQDEQQALLFILVDGSKSMVNSFGKYVTANGQRQPYGYYFFNTALPQWLATDNVPSQWVALSFALEPKEKWQDDFLKYVDGGSVEQTQAGLVGLVDSFIKSNQGKRWGIGAASRPALFGHISKCLKQDDFKSRRFSNLSILYITDNDFNRSESNELEISDLLAVKRYGSKNSSDLTWLWQQIAQSRQSYFFANDVKSATFELEELSSDSQDIAKLLRADCRNCDGALSATLSQVKPAKPVNLQAHLKLVAPVEFTMTSEGYRSDIVFNALEAADKYQLKSFCFDLLDNKGAAVEHLCSDVNYKGEFSFPVNLPTSEIYGKTSDSKLPTQMQVKAVLDYQPEMDIGLSITEQLLFPIGYVPMSYITPAKPLDRAAMKRWPNLSAVEIAASRHDEQLKQLKQLKEQQLQQRQSQLFMVIVAIILIAIASVLVAIWFSVRNTNRKNERLLLAKQSYPEGQITASLYGASSKEILTPKDQGGPISLASLHIDLNHLPSKAPSLTVPTKEVLAIVHIEDQAAPNGFDQRQSKTIELSLRIEDIQPKELKVTDELFTLVGLNQNSVSFTHQIQWPLLFNPNGLSNLTTVPLPNGQLYIKAKLSCHLKNSKQSIKDIDIELAVNVSPVNYAFVSTLEVV